MPEKLCRRQARNEIPARGILLPHKTRTREKKSREARQEEKRREEKRRGEQRENMGRGKIEIRRIDNPTSRQVTFSKRRGGLMKKAQELSILCDAQVGLIIFSTTGKLFEYASSSMKVIMDRYNKYMEEKIPEQQFYNDSNFWCQEAGRLKQEVERLHKAQRQMSGEDLTNVGIKELQQLERQLESGLNQVRSKKDQFFIEQIQDLHRKEHYLEEDNKNLQRKIVEVQKMAEAAYSSMPHDNNNHTNLLPPDKNMDNNQQELQMTKELQICNASDYRPNSSAIPSSQCLRQYRPLLVTGGTTTALTSTSNNVSSALVPFSIQPHQPNLRDSQPSLHLGLSGDFSSHDHLRGSSSGSEDMSEADEDDRRQAAHDLITINPSTQNKN